MAGTENPGAATAGAEVVVPPTGLELVLAPTEVRQAALGRAAVEYVELLVVQGELLPISGVLSL